MCYKANNFTWIVLTNWWIAITTETIILTRGKNEKENGNGKLGALGSGCSYKNLGLGFGSLDSII